MTEPPAPGRSPVTAAGLLLARGRCSTAAMVSEADRKYWGIENGLHLRLDVSGGEDRSRVRHPTSVLNLAMIRRATISVAIDWIERCRNQRQATLQGFYDFMSSKNQRKAFALVTAAVIPATFLVANWARKLLRL